MWQQVNSKSSLYYSLNFAVNLNIFKMTGWENTEQALLWFVFVLCMCCLVQACSHKIRSPGFMSSVTDPN